PRTASRASRASQVVEFPCCFNLLSAFAVCPAGLPGASTLPKGLPAPRSLQARRRFRFHLRAQGRSRKGSPAEAEGFPTASRLSYCCHCFWSPFGRPGKPGKPNSLFSHAVAAKLSTARDESYDDDQVAVGAGAHLLLKKRDS